MDTSLSIKCYHYGMIRTQVQLSERQVRELRKLSAAQGQSMAKLIRQGVDLYLDARRGPSDEERRQRALDVAGRFSSGLTDVSSEHDRYLADAYYSTADETPDEDSDT